MAKGSLEEKMYFCIGLITGVLFSSLFAILLTNYSFSTVKYYYYYNEKIFTIPGAALEAGVFYYEDKSQDPLSKSPPPFIQEKYISEEEEEELRFKSDELLSEERKEQPLSSQRASNLMVVLMSNERGGGQQNCQLEDYQELIKDTWGNNFNNIFLVENKKCKKSIEGERIPWLRKNNFSYSYDDGYLNINKLLIQLHNVLTSEHHWVLFVQPETYVNLKRLILLLDSHRYSDDLVFGKSSYKGLKEGGLSACGPNGGIVMSRRALARLIREGGTCLIGSESSPPISTMTHCIADSLLIGCSSHLPMLNSFDEDFILKDDKLSSLKYLYKQVTIHPVRSKYSFYTLHYYYTQLEYNETANGIRNLHRNMKRLLSKMAEANPKKTSPVPGFIFANDYPMYETPPTDMRELQAWLYFDSDNIYIDRDTVPRQSLGHWKNEIDLVLLEALRLANNDYHTDLVYHQLINGYLKHSPNGAHYILDVEFKEANNPYVTLQRRFSFMRPYQSSFLKLPAKNLNTEVINFIVPISSVGSRLDQFFVMYESLIPASLNHLHLILVVYNNDDIGKCRELISKYHKTYPSSKFSIVQGKGTFARAKALDAGTSILNDGDLMFFCDVDMDVTPEFLHRCRLNSVRGKQVYYPEVFKMYNMKYVYKLSRMPKHLSISRKHGHWGYYSYGMLCIYKGDYVKSGKLDTTYYGWGREDSKFHKRIIDYGYSVLRAPDPGLVHRWHPKVCNPNGQWKGDCISSLTESMADRKELGRYVLELEKNSSHLFCI